MSGSRSAFRPRRGRLPRWRIDPRRVTSRQLRYPVRVQVRRSVSLSEARRHGARDRVRDRKWVRCARRVTTRREATRASARVNPRCDVTSYAHPPAAGFTLLSTRLASATELTR